MLQDRFVAPIKTMIEKNPSFGYRTVAHLSGFNKNTAQRISWIKGWQVRKRLLGFRHPRWSMSAGPQTCAGSGLAVTAGPRWPW